MISTQSNSFTASTNKLAYAQAFTAGRGVRRAERTSLLQRLTARRTRTV